MYQLKYYLKDKMIYLDSNSSLPVSLKVVHIANKLIKKIEGNPSSIHKAGRKSNIFLERSKEYIVKYVGCLHSEIVFTSGGTESNNMVLKGFPYKNIIYSSMEHPSIYNSSNSKDVQIINTKNNGVIDVNDLKNKLAKTKSPLVSLMYANNETGIIQPIKDVVNMVKEVDGLVHSDIVQGFGKEYINFKDLGLDILSISSHKIGGLSGIGALIIKNNTYCEPLINGGNQQKGFRSGTQNLLGAIGFSESLKLNSIVAWKNIKVLRNAMEKLLVKEGAKIIGEYCNRLSNTSFISMPGVPSSHQIISFDMYNICVSSGSACSSGSISSVGILSTMNIKNNDYCRVSMSPNTTKNDLIFFINCWKKIYKSYLQKEN